VLCKYQKYVCRESTSVLEDLKIVVKHYEQKKFERVHFHFSGHGKDGSRVETEVGENSSGETVDLAKEASGECVIGNKLGGRSDSIHDLKLELLKLKTDKITVTLDCCRTVTRSITDLKEKKKIENLQHEKMFIVYPTLETQEATAEPGRSFTHFLCSVCEENGGAIEIREIAEKVNEKMKENNMTQRSKGDFVPGNGNWENYMWPHQLDKTAPPPPPPPQSTGQSIANSNIVQGKLVGSLNAASIGTGCNITVNK